MGRSLRPPLTGIGRYTLNLARGLTGESRTHDVSLYVTRETPLLGLDSCRVVRASFPTPHEVVRGIWEQTLVARDVSRTGADLYHSPNYAIPLRLPCPSVLTIHDLAYLDPRFHRQRLRIYLRLFTDFSVRRASRVISVSAFTKSEIIARYPGAACKVSVVRSGLDPIFERQPGAREARSFLDEIGQARPYVLSVGSIEPRKNIPALVAAFERVVRRSAIPHDLVICGPWGWRCGASREAIETSPFRERIRVLGYLPGSQLPLLYAGADLLAYPSLQEGFGFPPLEAMAMGTPVVTSDTSSLPEIVGDAAIMVPPTDVAALADAMETVLTDPGIADALTAKGYERSRRFTWAQATRETLEVYRLAAEAPAAA